MNPTNKKPTALTGKSYKSVTEMVRDMFGVEDPEFVEKFEERSRRRALVRALSVLRNRASLSQKELAQKMGCGQPKISKLESGVDADLSVRDILGYLEATGFEAKITFLSGEGAPLSEVKLHIPKPEPNRTSKRMRAKPKRRPSLSRVR